MSFVHSLSTNQKIKHVERTLILCCVVPPLSGRILLCKGAHINGVK